MVSREKRAEELRSALRTPIEDVQSCMITLQDLSTGDDALKFITLEHRLYEIATTLTRAAESLNALPARFNIDDGAASEARAESLRRQFSLTTDISDRFTRVMNYFKETAGFIPLSEVTPLLAQTLGGRKEDAQETARRKLQWFKDFGLLEVRRASGTWLYKLTDDARFFIDRGYFASMGVNPQK